MPHVLIAGTTGSGKSVLLNSLICSILYKSTPDEVKFILIDPKRIELGVYQDIPHLLTPVVTEPKKASDVLKWIVFEMKTRIKMLASEGVRNIDQYNNIIRGAVEAGEKKEDENGEPLRPLPYVMVVIDELADLMMVSSSDVEDSITRLAQMARAVGIHLVLATQRPSVDVITGIIKANFPTRIAFRVASRVDSRTILDSNGAEQLLGRGDMLLLPPGSARLVRLHGPFVSEAEVGRLVAFWRREGKPEYNQAIRRAQEANEAQAFEKDQMFDEAARLVVETRAPRRRHTFSAACVSATAAPPESWTCSKRTGSWGRPKVRTDARFSYRRTISMRSISSFASAALGSVVLLWALAPGVVEAQRSAATLYKDAQASEKKLQQSKARRSKKSEWNNVAKAYRKVVLAHPQSGYSDDALYYEGEILLEIHRRFDDRAARQRSLDTYLLLANDYPTSKWAKRARLTRAKIFLERSERKSASIELRKVTSQWPNTSQASEARRLLENMSRPKRADSERLPPGIVGVRNIRHWSDSKREYTRVVIDLDKDVKYRQGKLENPERIYFDLLGTRVTKVLASKPFPVDGGFLKQIRVGQNNPDTVRVVLDFESISDYNVFWLPDPYRLVVDISGNKPAPVPRTPEAVVTAKPTPERTTPTTPATPSGTSPSKPASEIVVDLPPPPRSDGKHSLAQQLGLEARRVVIDPGHGGHDPGTMSKKGLREKDVVLDISRRVSKLLVSEGFEVLMTRNKDVFIPLEERTAIANSKGADLFVSIHVNASRSSRPRGIETYYLNLATTPRRGRSRGSGERFDDPAPFGAQRTSPEGHEQLQDRRVARAREPRSD